MLPTTDELRKNYERYDDAKLIRLATEEADKLRPEAIELLGQIIKERGLSEAVKRSIDVQTKPLTENDLLNYTELLRKQPCPICNSTAEKLNGTMIATVMSFIVFSQYERKLIIACPDCLDKENKNAQLKTAIMGWWGIPWGLIRTPKALILNNKMKKQNRLPEASDLIKSYVSKNIGRIELNRDNLEGLQSVIKRLK